MLSISTLSAGLAAFGLAASASAVIVPVMPLPSSYGYAFGDVFHWTGGPGASGYYYMPVPAAGLTYAQALAAAASTPNPIGVPSGYTPHLLTVTSAAEANMIDAVFPGGIGSTWIAVQQTSPGNWVYTAGPEIGQSVSSFLTPNWISGSPQPGDPFVYLDCSTNEWVSASATFTEGYVVEFSIPTPGAAALLGLGGVIATRRRRS